MERKRRRKKTEWITEDIALSVAIFMAGRKNPKYST
jgi:hypothetical protein